MALIIPDGFGQAVYELALAGDNEPIVVTCGHDATEFVGTFQEEANALHTAFKAEVLPTMTNDYTSVGVTWYRSAGSDVPIVITSTTAAQVGPGSAAGLPQNCAMLVRKRTDLAGRRGRGRLYLPGLEEGLVNELGVITGTAVDAFQAQFNEWHAALVALPLPPVVLHRSEGAGVEPPPTPITSFSVDATIATQRQRLRR